jgi:hypothetical protein
MNLDEAFEELRSKNESVPLPLRLPTELEVEDAENRLGTSFPPDFRRYLLEASDIVCGTVEPVTITVPGSHTDLYRVVKDAWDVYGVPRELLPLCESNADFYCMNSDNEIVFWSHNGWSSEKWPSLAHWVKEVWIEFA